MQTYENCKQNTLSLLKLRQARYLPGIILTLVLSVLARKIATFPYVSVMGTMVLAILLGIAWQAIMDVPQKAREGIDFTAKKILRLGIILMGIRLNINSIISMGPKILLFDLAVITFAVSFIYFLGRQTGVDKKMALLTGVGTGVCGAAAVAATAPAVEANEEQTAVSVAIISLLGTAGTVAYTFLLQMGLISRQAYGIFAGATLHELAHVVAAAQPAGTAAVQMAVLVKLGRVALLAPAVLVIGFFYHRTQNPGAKYSFRNLPFPCFILGFLGVSIINTAGILPPRATSLLLNLSVLFLTMAMAALGLNVNISSLHRLGKKPFAVGFLGSIVLSLLSFWLIIHFGF
ncbi:MAG: hypothetical protein PWQ31_29 [Eubacteriales bacterium]|nr:hypothetical protein [Eubacteriales bacterium]